MPTSLQAFSSLAMPSAMSMGLIALALYVALELSHRARIDSLGARNGWLVLSALALSVGVVSAQILQLCSLLGPLEAGFHPGLLISSALAALVLSSAALNWVLGANVGWLQLLSGAAMLGLATTLGQVLAVSSAGVSPSVRWNLGGLALVWLASAAGFVWLLLIAAQPRKVSSFRFQPRLLAAATGAGAAVLAGQSIGLAASTIRGSSPVDDPTLLSAQTMATVASIGLAELLLLMLLACAVEARLRSKLESSSLSQQEGYRDGLTRLPTRTTFEGTLAQVLQNADIQRTPAVLLHVALDRFKPINDSYGHQAGDAVLRCIALRLKALAPPHRVARLGGDEFLLLLDGKESLEQSTSLAAAILESTSQPCQCDGRELAVTCSIGIAQYPRHGARTALITHATVATRASKAAGGATYSMFDPRMVDDVRDQAELLNDLRQALMRGQMELYYQPKIHAPSAQVTAAEALLRWHHPRRGMISPAVFIPLAERNGLIGTLGAWVIDEACKQARLWRDQGLRMRVAINLSAHQLRQANLPAHIAAVLAKHQINPDLLTCEVTESVAMEDTEATMRFFSELAAVGVHISIDDFGSGYSSLAYLRKLPATELKIDRGFVLDLENSEEARKIAEAVVNLAQALNMKVVAEGVETDAQYQILRRLGCDQVQGFLFAKPMTAKALALWASGSDGPRSIQFRESLFKETSALVA